MLYFPFFRICPDDYLAIFSNLSFDLIERDVKDDGDGGDKDSSTCSSSPTLSLPLSSSSSSPSSFNFETPWGTAYVFDDIFPIAFTEKLKFLYSKLPEVPL